MLLKAWTRFLSPVDPSRVDDSQAREIRFLRIIGLVMALTYPTWYWVNQAAVADFHEPLFPRLALGALGLIAAISTRLSKVCEEQIRALFYAIAILVAAHMVYLVNDNDFHSSYTTDALTTCMLVEFCMPTLLGAIAFPLIAIAMAAALAFSAESPQAWFFFGLLAQTMVVAFVIVATRLRHLQEINRTSKAYKAAKLAAEAANEAKSRFLAVMSHEIRTPMNSILGLVELMEQEEIPESQRASLRDIHSGAEVLLGLVNDLLDLSRIESGRVELECISFSLHDRMRKTLSLVGPQATAKGLQLRYVTRNLPDPLWVKGDPLRLQQALYNLLSNAIKFTEKGWVTLIAEGQSQDREKIGLRLAVRDTGIGIPAEKLSTIFESFVQAETSTARQFGGSGLGLAIAREVVALMGGKLEVSSRPGSGSEFYFSADFPKTEASALLVGREGEEIFASGPHPAVKDAEDDAEPGKGMRILVVDDNPVNLKVATAMLHRLGCKVITSRDGEEGMQTWLNQGPFDLIFMDCLMPNLDGYRATQMIRQQEATLPGHPHIPIIALTANAMQGEKERCQQSGMDDYLSKPVQMAQLKSSVKRWGKKPSPMEELPPAGDALA